MRTFNLKGQVLVQHPYNDSDAPARTIYPEPLRLGERNWVQRN